MRLLSLISNIFWFPFSLQKPYPYQLQTQQFNNKNYIMYKNNENQSIIHSNICPHQGGIFSTSGFISKRGNVVCGYHGFEYKNGSFVGICHQPCKTKEKKKHVPTLFSKQTNDMIFVSNESNPRFSEIFFPPEEYNSSFRAVTGHIRLRNNYLTVTENLLDMLHISYVHSFGSRFSLPQNLTFVPLSPIHGRSSFYYQPNKKSLSTLLEKKYKKEKASVVHVENEFCLPTNTVTRVKVQDKDVKTIFTRSIPINENETILYWKLYRNFWIGNTIMNCIGDFFVRKLMNQVVQEDVNILQGIDVKNKDGPVKTKYDKTILMYRKFIKDFME
jgi:phenylpropionate dioxygenase-like ring-hydroxylating dioxygenase large terminal subunit